MRCSKRNFIELHQNGGARIRSEGRGSTDPVAPNDTLENRAKTEGLKLPYSQLETGPKLGSEVEVKPILPLLSQAVMWVHINNLKLD